jgi:hypothetical protein
MLVLFFQVIQEVSASDSPNVQLQQDLSCSRLSKDLVFGALSDLIGIVYIASQHLL